MTNVMTPDVADECGANIYWEPNVFNNSICMVRYFGPYRFIVGRMMEGFDWNELVDCKVFETWPLAKRYCDDLIRRRFPNGS